MVDFAEKTNQLATFCHNSCVFTALKVQESGGTILDVIEKNATMTVVFVSCFFSFLASAFKREELDDYSDSCFSSRQTRMR